MGQTSRCWERNNRLLHSAVTIQGNIACVVLENGPFDVQYHIDVQGYGWSPTPASTVTVHKALGSRNQYTH